MLHDIVERDFVVWGAWVVSMTLHIVCFANAIDYLGLTCQTTHPFGCVLVLTRCWEVKNQTPQNPFALRLLAYVTMQACCLKGILFPDVVI